MKTIAVLVGSLRRESINRKLAVSLAQLAGDRLRFDIVELADVPMYNDDLIADLPAAVARLKSEIERADGVLFVSPEYNRSFTPVIKNAIDWATRPNGQNSLRNKRAGVVGTSPGAIGSAVGQNQLKSVLLAAGVSLMSLPEVYLRYQEGMIDVDGVITDQPTEEFLQSFIKNFVAWVNNTNTTVRLAQTT